MATTLEQLQYGFDRDSRRTWRQRAVTQGWDNAYVYDSLSQVIGDDRGDLNLARNAIAGVPSTGSRWQYDETGNWHGYQTQVAGAVMLTQSRTHDKGNRLMEVSEAAAMRTDRAGRMLETVPGPGGDWDQGYQITWDAWSRIVGVASVDGETVTPVATYGYDGLTRRITCYTDNEDVTHHSYYSEEWRPLEERKDSETTASASYLWGSRHRDDLVRRDRAVGGTTLNETRYLLMDYFSPAAITDEEGEVTERYQFSAFGLRTILNPDFTVRSDSECAMEFAFQGQFEDLETGWLNYGYRYYLPPLGRWACKDPIGELGGVNLYAMVDNHPVNSVDLFGLDECSKGQTKIIGFNPVQLFQVAASSTDKDMEVAAFSGTNAMEAVGNLGPAMSGNAVDAAAGAAAQQAGSATDLGKATAEKIRQKQKEMADALKKMGIQEFYWSGTLKFKCCVCPDGKTWKWGEERTLNFQSPTFNPNKKNPAEVLRDAMGKAMNNAEKACSGK